LKLSTLFLSSAALVVAGSAYAADLPAKKGAPAAKAATGCPAFGAGYFQIPGGDTCIKFSGYARSDNTYTSNVSRPANAPYSLSAAYGVQFDAQSSSEMGAVKSTILLEGTTSTASATDAYVQVGSFVAGKAPNILDYSLGYSATGAGYGSHTGQLQYGMPMGASTLTVALTSAENNNDTGSVRVASRPDVTANLSTTVGSLGLNLGVASHEISYSGASAQGFAVVGKIKYATPVATLSVYGGYANGASTYTGNAYTATYAPVYDSDTSAANLATSSIVQGQVDIPVGTNTSIGVMGEQRSVTQNTASYARSTTALSIKQTLAKGLWIRPEVYQTNYSSTITNGAYLRIERDF